MFRKCFNTFSRDTAGVLPMSPHLCHFSGHQPDIQIPEPAFLWLWFFFLTLEPAFPDSMPDQNRQGIHGPQEQLSTNELLCPVAYTWGMYQQSNPPTEGLELVTSGGALLLMHLYYPSSLPCITAPSLLSVPFTHNLHSKSFLRGCI